MLRFAVLLAVAGLSTAAVAAETPSVELGKHISIVGGCHDCHTVGYAQSGQIDPDKALKGNPVGYEGPWGTNFAKTFTAPPPMPWFNVHELTEVESRSLYEYIKSLPGDNGQEAPADIPPKK